MRGPKFQTFPGPPRLGENWTNLVNYESDDEQSKKQFYYHESNNNKKNIENDNSVTLYVCMVRSLKEKPYNKTLINLDRLVIREEYQTSIFYVRPLSDIFR